MTPNCRLHALQSPCCVAFLDRLAFTRTATDREREREQREERNIWECHFYVGKGEKEHHFVRKFPGFARSSFWE